MRFSHPTLIFLSGALWFAVGIYLLPLGISFLYQSTGNSLSPFLSQWGLYGDQAYIILIALGLGMGFLKSRMVFAKVVEKGVAHIRTLPLQAPIQAVYTRKYLLLLGVMVLLGMSLKWLHIPLDIRGFIDVAIGSALINGATMYFRKAIEYKQTLNV